MKTNRMTPSSILRFWLKTSLGFVLHFFSNLLFILSLFLLHSVCGHKKKVPTGVNDEFSLAGKMPRRFVFISLGIPDYSAVSPKVPSASKILHF